MKLFTKPDQARRDAIDAQLSRIARRGEYVRDRDALERELDAIEQRARAHREHRDQA